MRIVIDTNILVNAMRHSGNRHSKARQLLFDVYQGKYDVCASREIIEEYKNVFARPEIKIGKIRAGIWLTWLQFNGIIIEPQPTTQEQVQMKDEDDRKFFDVARCMNAKLVTRNYKDYPVHELVTSLDELY